MVDEFIFSNFLVALKDKLGYTVGIDKYRDFLHAFSNGLVPVDDYEHFCQFCRFMFLQNQTDAKRFQKVVDDVLKNEIIRVVNKYEGQAIKKAEEGKKDKGGKDSGDSQASGQSLPPKVKPPPERKPVEDLKPIQDSTEMYFHPETLTKDTGDMDGPIPKNGIHTDEYFPLTRRQMVKTWHFLRREEKRGLSNEIDILGTVQKIAIDGAFLSPVFKPNHSNRKNTLVILADCRGSMAPFHALTDRLITTAQGEGGLKDTKVFYFQNYPLKYVYSKPGLVGPVKIEKAFSKANKYFTVAIIISDAGAARGNYVPERVKAIIGKAEKEPNSIPCLLDRLQERFAFFIWLNPLPQHRWANTSAQPIADKIKTMYPVLEEDQFDFQHIIKSLMGRRNVKADAPTP